MYLYPVKLTITKDVPGFMVDPGLPEVVTHGTTLAEAQEIAADALELMLLHYIKEKRPIPTLSRRRRKKYQWVPVSA